MTYKVDTDAKDRIRIMEIAVENTGDFSDAFVKYRKMLVLIEDPESSPKEKEQK